MFPIVKISNFAALKRNHPSFLRHAVKFWRSFFEFLVELLGDVEDVHGERPVAGEELRGDVVPDFGRVEGDDGRGDGLHDKLGSFCVLRCFHFLSVLRIYSNLK